MIGAGGVGAYFGGRWAQAGHDVTFVARGAQGEALRSEGLEIRSPLGQTRVTSFHVTDDPREIGAADVVLVATKTWQLDAASRFQPDIMDPDGVVFGVQNGVEAAEVLARHHPRERVLGGTCRIISMVREPGVVEHLGVPPEITVGEVDGGASARVEALAAALDVGQVLTVRASDDIRRDLWRKFLFFASVSGLGSVARAPIGTLRAEPATRAVLHAAVREVHAVGVALGVHLDADDPERAVAFLNSVPAEGTSSMQRDVEEGRPTELEALSGAVVRLGREVGVPTPVHDVLYAALLPADRAART